jgi:hypothetical protein
LGAHPVRLVSLVLVDVSSIKTNCAKALLKKRRRRSIHSSRADAISGRNCSLALRLFFIAQPKPVEKSADCGAVDQHTASGQLDAQLIQRDLSIVGNTLGNPFAVCRQLASTRGMALSGRRQRARRPMEDHHIVDKSGRHSEMPGGFPMAIAFFHKRNHTHTQLDRMRFAHGGSPSMGY